MKLHRLKKFALPQHVFFTCLKSRCCSFILNKNTTWCRNLINPVPPHYSVTQSQNSLQQLSSSSSPPLLLCCVTVSLSHSVFVCLPLALSCIPSPFDYPRCRPHKSEPSSLLFCHVFLIYFSAPLSLSAAPHS